MDEFNGGLRASDVIKLIKQCAESGVREFRFGYLEFRLGTRDNELDRLRAESRETAVHRGLVESGEVVGDEINSEMEAEIHEQQLEELLIADPLRHEELAQKLLDGEEIYGG